MKEVKYPLRMTIGKGFGDQYIVKNWHWYHTPDPIQTILFLMDDKDTYEAVINGIRFEGATKGSVEVALKLFFKKYKILEKIDGGVYGKNKK